MERILPVLKKVEIMLIITTRPGEKELVMVLVTAAVLVGEMAMV